MVCQGLCTLNVLYSFYSNQLFAALTKSLFPSGPGNLCRHFSLVLLFCILFFYFYNHEKSALFMLKPHSLPHHAPPHRPASCANMGATSVRLPPPPLRFLHLSLYSMLVFPLYPAPSTFILYHSRTHTGCACAPKQTAEYVWLQLFPFSRCNLLYTSQTPLFLPLNLTSPHSVVSLKKLLYYCSLCLYFSRLTWKQ